ncbi:MAG: hypothetical protein ACI82F_002768, partial [Planctomycetota bacterium]
RELLVVPTIGSTRLAAVRPTVLLSTEEMSGDWQETRDRSRNR